MTVHKLKWVHIEINTLYLSPFDYLKFETMIQLVMVLKIKVDVSSTWWNGGGDQSSKFS